MIQKAILSESEYKASQQRGDLPYDLSYEAYVALRQEQLDAAAARRAAMNPLDREILEYHEALRKEQTPLAA